VTGKVDGTWSISAMDDVPTSSGTGTAAYASGSTTFTNAASAPHWLRVGDEVVISATTLVVTAVPTSSSFKVAGNYAAATSWARKAAWNTSGMTKRLYRTSGTLATFQLVAENITTTTYSDTLTDALILGDELISAGWEPPPATLTGVVTHSSGSLVGFTGTLLCASVPYQPHAWVTAYQLSTEYDIVGIASYGSEIAIATLGTPYVASGVEPESVTMQKINGLYPCLSKRSVVSVGDGAVYASGHGLMYIGQSGVSLYTKKFFSKDEWITHLPANMVCEFAYGRVYVSTTGSNGLKYMFIFEGDVLTTADFTAYDLYTDAATGTLYVAAASSIQEWDHAGSAPLTMAWKSKRFVLPPPQNFGAAKIEFDQAVPEAIRTAILDEIASKTAANAALMAAGNTGGSYGAKSYNVLAVDNSDLVPVPDVPAVNEVTFILYSKGVPVFARVVSSEKAFRLPAGFKTDEIEVQVNSQCVVNAIRLATTMTALNQA
jgi:hypothetical protein